MMSEVTEKDLIDKIIEKESMRYFKRFMVSMRGKWWSESTESEWKLAYKQAFLAGFKAGLKRANYEI